MNVSTPRYAGTPVVYTCAACKGPATVRNGTVVRPCGHAQAAVTASLTATAYGESKTKG